MFPRLESFYSFQSYNSIVKSLFMVVKDFTAYSKLQQRFRAITELLIRSFARFCHTSVHFKEMYFYIRRSVTIDA